MSMNAIGSSLLSRLLDEHGDALVLYAQQWCNGPEDVVQEAFIRLMRQRPAPENIVGWLYRVVRNEAISLSRSEARRVRHEKEATREPSFVATYGDRLDAEAADTALASLPIEQRETIVLRIWSSLTFEQIAELTDTSTSTAHRRYEAGMTALRNNWSIPCQNRESQQQ
jgi:RNA polymerase sigma factor (sigma-70 family)